MARFTHWCIESNFINKKSKRCVYTARFTKWLYRIYICKFKLCVYGEIYSWVYIYIHVYLWGNLLLCAKVYYLRVQMCDFRYCD